MPSARMALIVITLDSLLLQPVFGEKRKLYLRGQAGYMLGLDDTPPHAWLGGTSLEIFSYPFLIREDRRNQPAKLLATNRVGSTPSRSKAFCCSGVGLANIGNG